MEENAKLFLQQISEQINRVKNKSNSNELKEILEKSTDNPFEFDFEIPNTFKKPNVNVDILDINQNKNILFNDFNDFNNLNPSFNNFNFFNRNLEILKNIPKNKEEVVIFKKSVDYGTKTIDEILKGEYPIIQVFDQSNIKDTNIQNKIFKKNIIIIKFPCENNEFIISIIYNFNVENPYVINFFAIFILLFV